MSKSKQTGKRSRRRASVNGWDSSLGAARGELLLVEYAAKKAAKELRTLADRVERMGQCAREAGERINPVRSPNAEVSASAREESKP